MDENTIPQDDAVTTPAEEITPEKTPSEEGEMGTDDGAETPTAE